MKFLFYLGHPAHYHLFKNTIKQLIENNHEAIILIKKKDVLEELVKGSGYSYSNILPKGRKDSKFGIALGLIKRDIRILSFCLKNRPDVMVGTSAEITHVGRILRIPSINVNEDDFDVVPLFAMLGYPLASSILVPKCCRTGRWHYKTIYYNGYHELAYLHPNYFIPKTELIKDKINLSEPYFLLRFAKLSAHHDEGITGITTGIAQKIITLLKPHGSIFIISERKLEREFEQYRIKIHPINIHHALYYARLYIGDSQTMAAEAAVLGTPSLRFNDFVGRLSYLEELEHKYMLTYGVKTSNAEKLYRLIEELVSSPSIKEEWQGRRQKMLSEKIDVAAFMLWFIVNYPKSITLMRKNPSCQNEFQSGDPSAMQD